MSSVNFCYLSLPDQAMLTTLLCQPHRKYHNICHVYDSLTQMEQFFAARMADSSGLFDESEMRGILTYAIWYHDAVYNPYTPGINEKESAELFCSQYEDQVNVRSEAENCWFENVQNAIYATAYHLKEQQHLNFFIQTMLDIDLAGLGSNNSVYRRNGDNIRHEYWNTSDAEFMEGRIKFLKGMLNKPRIYYTAHFYDRFESQARQNMQTEYDSLR